MLVLYEVWRLRYFAAVSQREIALVESAASLLPHKLYIGQGPAAIRIAACRMILEAVRQMASMLRSRALRYFDPLVGECACHIRAFYIAQHVDRVIATLDELLKRVSLAAQALARAERHLASQDNETVSIRELLDSVNNPGARLLLTPEQLFFLESYLLTLTKVSEPLEYGDRWSNNEYTDFKALARLFKVSNTVSREVTKHLRKRLARASVAYMRSVAMSISYHPEMFAASYQTEHKGLSCVPNFWSMGALLHKGRSAGTPILLVSKAFAIDEGYRCMQVMRLFLRPTAAGYVACHPRANELGRSAVIVEGVTARTGADLPELEEWTVSLAAKNVEDVILANAAAHTQYPGGHQDSLLDGATKANRRMYGRFLGASRDWGCSRENPSLFLITHIFPCHLTDSLVTPDQPRAQRRLDLAGRCRADRGAEAARCSR